MSKNLNKKEIEKFSRQIILKNIGATGQKKILSSKVLIVGMGGLGCPVAEFLTRSGIGTLGIADEMLVATQENLPVDVAIFSAAVADFKINKKYENKIKKQENLNLNLEKNVDILHYVSNHNSMRPELVIGFAAETNQIDKNAEEKLNKKNCDWIISNDVSNKDIGFNSDYNEVTIHYKNKDVKKEKLSYKKKSGISDEIVDRIIDQLN